MKVLAENNDKYIIQVTDNELANIMGFSSCYDDGFKYNIKDIVKYNGEIEVSRIYKSHQAIEHLKIYSTVKDARASITKILDALTPIEEIIKGIPTVKVR